MKGMTGRRAGVHFEDQLASEKCGHMGGKVLVPTRSSFARSPRRAWRPTCRRAHRARRPHRRQQRPTAHQRRRRRDRRFITGERTPRLLPHRGGLDIAIDRGLSYAPYADLIWCETSTPDLDEARRFAEAMHAQFPGKLLAYNCSPSFNWKKKLDDATIARFQRELGAMGYKYQFITLAGFHALNLSMFELALGYRDTGMRPTLPCKSANSLARPTPATATKHQRFVGTLLRRSGPGDRQRQLVDDGPVARRKRSALRFSRRRPAGQWLVIRRAVVEAICKGNGKLGLGMVLSCGSYTAGPFLF